MNKPTMIASLALFLLACNIIQKAFEPPIPPNSSESNETSSSAPSPLAPTPVTSNLVWFGPNMGSTDYPELFTKPEQWSEARSRIDVFKFHSQNLLYYDCKICGDNNLSAFVPVQAFRKLSDWGLATGIDVGAVKEWGCTGTREFEVTKTAVENVRSHGGSVNFLVMDEPFLGGEWAPTGSKPCGFSMEQSADVTAKFMNLVKGTYPDILVGNTEPYPYFSITELEQWIEALEARGSAPAFFHLDVDFWRAGVEGQNLASDLQTLSQFTLTHGIPFGVIITSAWNEAETDRDFYNSTMDWIGMVKAAIGKPEQVIFNAWQGPAPSGAHEVPINLPEYDPTVFSHTRLILEGLEMFDQ